MNGQQIDLSFIIPCYNLEPYIEKLLLSFYMHNFKNINVEFIFILDHCDDNTEQVIIDYMGEANYKILKGNYYSCGLARNRGMEEAQGEYIWFVDGDDWLIYPNTAADCLDVLREYDLDMIQIYFVSNFYQSDCDSMVWQYIFKHSLIEDLRFRAEQPGEDGDFIQKVIDKRGTKVTQYKIPSYFYNYNRPGSNMTLNKMKKLEETKKRLAKFDLDEIL